MVINQYPSPGIMLQVAARFIQPRSNILSAHHWNEAFKGCQRQVSAVFFTWPFYHGSAFAWNVGFLGGCIMNQCTHFFAHMLGFNGTWMSQEVSKRLGSVGYNLNILHLQVGYN